jgi:uracil-DNA glycosylase
MGLDPAQLKLDPLLLPFYRSGLRYLFQPGGEQASSRREGTSQSGRTRDRWLAYLQDLTPPYSAVITYWKLSLDQGADLGEESLKRRDLFARMLTGLAWPEGEYVFWPHSDCRERQIHADPPLFWHGIGALRPRYVLLFGERAASILLPGHEAGTSRVDLEGVTYVLLPDPDEMLPDNRRAKNLVWRELKSLPIPA